MFDYSVYMDTFFLPFCLKIGTFFCDSSKVSVEGFPDVIPARRYAYQFTDIMVGTKYRFWRKKSKYQRLTSYILVQEL